MNRGFLVVLAPGLLVALLYLGFGWKLHISLTLGVVLLAVGGAALLWERRRHRQASLPTPRGGGS